SYSGPFDSFVVFACRRASRFASSNPRCQSLGPFAKRPPIAKKSLITMEVNPARAKKQFEIDVINHEAENGAAHEPCEFSSFGEGQAHHNYREKRE
ncbi:MAG: hypothetical protein KGJ84_12155, partial [Elusimicrobia bacterium]|nr:hypothetical protein [Elusimicrobiota bacterium]